MSRYKVVFDDSQATVLTSLANNVNSFEAKLLLITNGIDTRDGSMASLKRQVRATAATLPPIAVRMRGESNAWRQSVALYKRAETGACDQIASTQQGASIWDLLRIILRFPSFLLPIIIGPALPVFPWLIFPWWFKPFFPAPAPGGGAVPGEGVVVVPKPPLLPVPPKSPVKPVSNEKLKPYPGAEYHDYSVIKGFDTAYCYNQNNYKRFLNKSGKNVGCTATAEAIVVSMAKGKPISPDEMGWSVNSDGSVVGSTWKHSHEIPKSAGASQAEKLMMIADQIAEGNAVVVRANNNHSVAAIGIREGATPSNLTPADILILDPADGKVKTLDKALNGGCNMPDSWSLRVAN